MYSYAAPPLPPVDDPTPRSSAARAGWICIVAGILTIPLLGFGFLLLGIAFILAIVAMATHQIREGFCILLTSVASIFVGWIAVAVFLVNGTASIFEEAAASLPKPPKLAALRTTPLVIPEATLPKITKTQSIPIQKSPVTFSASPGIEVQNEVFNVTGAWGAKHTDLLATFPGAEAARPEATVIIDGWRGWKSVHLGFNSKSRLASITFIPTHPVDLVHAKDILREQFQFPIPTVREIQLPDALVYRDIPGRIRTLNLGYADNGRTKKVNEFSFYFNIQWNE
jgi:hypothetical protein